MKIWNGYGSEHSMNLVLIGRFKEVNEAAQMENLLDKLSQQVDADETFPVQHAGQHRQRFSDGMSELLRANNLYMLSPADLDQFAAEHRVERAGERIVVRTEEVDVSAFIKLFVEAGARVEVYSGHDYPDAYPSAS